MLGDIARAKGMGQVAREAGFSRESLYKALSGERRPDFNTILKVVGALGLKLHAEAGPRLTAAYVEAGACQRAIPGNARRQRWHVWQPDNVVQPAAASRPRTAGIRPRRGPKPAGQRGP